MLRKRAFLRRTETVKGCGRQGMSDAVDVRGCFCSDKETFVIGEVPEGGEG